MTTDPRDTTTPAPPTPAAFDEVLTLCDEAGNMHEALASDCARLDRAWPRPPEMELPPGAVLITVQRDLRGTVRVNSSNGAQIGGIAMPGGPMGELLLTHEHCALLGITLPASPESLRVKDEAHCLSELNVADCSTFKRWPYLDAEDRSPTEWRHDG